jgi:hypothetical protein
MLREVALVLHKLPEVADDVRRTDDPPQNVVGPPAVIVGVGTVLTVTTVGDETALVQPVTTLRTV